MVGLSYYHKNLITGGKMGRRRKRGNIRLQNTSALNPILWKIQRLCSRWWGCKFIKPNAEYFVLVLLLMIEIKRDPHWVRQIYKINEYQHEEMFDLVWRKVQMRMKSRDYESCLMYEIRRKIIFLHIKQKRITTEGLLRFYFGLQVQTSWGQHIEIYKAQLTYVQAKSITPPIQQSKLWLMLGEGQREQAAAQPLLALPGPDPEWGWGERDKRPAPPPPPPQPLSEPQWGRTCWFPLFHFSTFFQQPYPCSWCWTSPCWVTLQISQRVHTGEKLPVVWDW